MDAEKVGYFIASIFAGGVTAAILVWLIRGFPQISFSRIYLNVQVALFFILLGLIPTFVFNASRKQKLVFVYVLATGLAGSALFYFLTGFTDTGIPYAIRGIAIGLFITMFSYKDVISLEPLYKFSAILTTLLFVFGLIFIGALAFRNGLVFLLPLLLVIPIFAATTWGIRVELQAV